MKFHIRTKGCRHGFYIPTFLHRKIMYNFDALRNGILLQRNTNVINYHKLSIKNYLTKIINY